MRAATKRQTARHEPAKLVGDDLPPERDRLAAEGWVEACGEPGKFARLIDTMDGNGTPVAAIQKRTLYEQEIVHRYGNKAALAPFDGIVEAYAARNGGELSSAVAALIEPDVKPPAAPLKVIGIPIEAAGFDARTTERLKAAGCLSIDNLTFMSDSRATELLGSEGPAVKVQGADFLDRRSNFPRGIPLREIGLQGGSNYSTVEQLASLTDQECAWYQTTDVRQIARNLIAARRAAGTY